MFFCGTLLAVLATVESSEVPACSAKTGIILEADDDSGALSLMQRHAYRTSHQDTGTSNTRPVGSEAAVEQERSLREETLAWKAPHLAPPKSIGAVEISSKAQAAVQVAEEGVVWRKQRKGQKKKLAAEAMVSMPRHQSSVLDSIGPVPLSLLAMENDVNFKKAATLSGISTVLLIAIALVAICLIIIMYCLVSERKVMIQNQRLENEKSMKKGFIRNVSSSSPPSKSVVDERFSLNGGRMGTGTQSSLSSTNSLSRTRAQGHYSPLAPQLCIPGPQKQGDQAVLHFPLKAASQNERGSHNVYWHDMTAPWFRLDIEAGFGSQQEQLSLYEVHSGSNMLCARVTLTQPDLSEGAQSYFVDNSLLLAPTNGLNMRTRKSMEDASRDAIRVIAWGQMITGIDGGDDWLEVREGGNAFYLPMVVNGKKTVRPASAIAGANQIDICNAAGALFATFRWNAKEGGTYRYTAIRNEVKIADVQIPGQSGLLLEATLGSRRLAHVDAISMGGGQDQHMLEMLVEQMDPVVMLLGAIGMLRRLPPHGRT